MDWVMDCLFLGSRYAAADKQLLKNAGISSVVNVTMDQPNFWAQEGVEYLRIEVEDDPGQNLLVHLHPAADWIHERISRGTIVLVHCRGGISRSPSVVLGYLVKHRGMSLREAIDHVSKHRRIDPNPGFLRQLVAFEIGVRGTPSIRVRDPEVPAHGRHGKGKRR